MTELLSGKAPERVFLSCDPSGSTVSPRVCPQSRRSPCQAPSPPHQHRGWPRGSRGLGRAQRVPPGWEGARRAGMDHGGDPNPAGKGLGVRQGPWHSLEPWGGCWEGAGGAPGSGEPSRAGASPAGSGHRTGDPRARFAPSQEWRPCFGVTTALLGLWLSDPAALEGFCSGSVAHGSARAPEVAAVIRAVISVPAFTFPTGEGN